jgi:F-type H+-transporting ATPase subunit alpha
MVQVLKQKQFSPLPVEKQIAIIFAGGQGFLDDLRVDQVKAFEDEMYKFLDNSKPGILEMIRTKKVMDDTVKGDLTAALKEFKERFVSDQKAQSAQPAHA